MKIKQSNRKLTKILSLLLYITITFGILSGCGGNSNGTQSETQSETQFETSSNEVKLELNEKVNGNVNLNQELLINGNFENVNNPNNPAAFTDWTFHPATCCSVSSNVTYNNSKYSLCISANDTTTLPYVRQQINNLITGVKYHYSAKILVTDMISSDYRRGIGITVNIIDSNGDIRTKANTFAIAPTNGEWIDADFWFIVPEDAAYIVIKPQLKTQGTVYIDNVSIKVVDEIWLETDEILYYSDMEKGYATATLTPNPEANYSGIKFSISDGNNVLSSAEYSLNKKDGSVIYTKYEDGKKTVKWDYNLQVLAKEKTAYILKATLLDDNGNSVGEKITEIYKYPRPTVMDKDGNIIVDGKIMNAKFMYHPVMDELDVITRLGYNVMEVDGFSNLERTQQWLDMCEAAGVKAAVAIHKNYKAAGDPENVEFTKNVVTRFKDHPALLAWIPMDEPTSQLGDQYEQQMLDSYKLIRDMDPDHLVFICQAQTIDKEMKYMEKCCDVLAIDPYPWMNDRPAGYITYASDMAVEATKYSNKPVWLIMQTFAYSSSQTGGQWIFPTADHYRNSYYRGLFAGVEGIGAYPYADPWKLLDFTKNLSQYPEIWDYMCGFHMEGGEGTIADELFKNGKLISSFENRYVLTRAFERNGKIYLIVLNNDKYKAEETISLVGLDGKTPVGNYVAIQLYGFGDGEDGKVITGNGTLTVNMKSEQAFVYEIEVKP